MRSAMIVIAAISLVFIDIVIHGAEVLQKPTRHPGDWWEVRIKTENTLRNVERFYRLDGEYRIEVLGDGLKCLYKEAGKWTDDCDNGKGVILDALLGIGKEKYLSFPIAVGSRWKFSFTDFRRHCYAGEAVVSQREKVSVAGKTFEAFRIERESEYRGKACSGSTHLVTILYWYAPACKCIPSVKLKSGGHDWGGSPHGNQTHKLQFSRIRAMPCRKV